MEYTENNAPTKWLRYLFCTQLLGLLISLLALIPRISWIGNAGIAVGLVSGVCLFFLIPLQPRYKKAAIFLVLAYVLQAICLLLEISTAIAVIFYLVALHQEYQSHSELLADRDGRLSHNWNRLFLWHLVVDALSGVLGSAAVVILARAELEAVTIVTIILGLIRAAGYMIRGIYLSYLHRTAKLFEV